jgi:hypothetical protein
LNVWLTVSLTVWLSVSLTVWLSVSLLSGFLFCQPDCLAVSQPDCVAVCLCVRLPVFVNPEPACLALIVSLPVLIYVSLSAWVFVNLPAWLYTPAIMSVCFSSFLVSLPADCHSVSLSFCQYVCHSACLLFVLVYAFVNLLASNMYSSLSEIVYVLSLLLYLYVCLFLFTFAEFHKLS